MPNVDTTALKVQLSCRKREKSDVKDVKYMGDMGTGTTYDHQRSWYVSDVGDVGDVGDVKTWVT